MQDGGGGIYQIHSEIRDIGVKTRGIQLKDWTSANSKAASEFYESKLMIKPRSRTEKDPPAKIPGAKARDCAGGKKIARAREDMKIASRIQTVILKNLR